MIELLNEDCYEAIKKIPDKSVDLIYTDIPYDFEGNGGGGAFGSKKRDYHNEYEKLSERKQNSRINEAFLKNMSKDTNLSLRQAKNNDTLAHIAFGIDYAILDEFVRVLKKINIYIWCSKKQIPYLLTYFLEKGCFWDLFVWHKSNPIPTCNNKYLSDTEYCLIFREEGTTVNYGTYETKGKYYISEINKKDKDLYNHPTIKPLIVVRNHIINSTQEGDLILDPFMGSGTTGVACQELKRDFIGIEISKDYFNIAKDRINGISQVERKEMENGQMSLDDLFT